VKEARRAHNNKTKKEKGINAQGQKVPTAEAIKGWW